MADLICGREFKTTTPGKQGNLPSYSRQRKPYGRFIVDGVNHPKGLPIRFKSRDAAERGIRNMGLSLEG